MASSVPFRRRGLAERLAQHPLFGSLQAVTEFQEAFREVCSAPTMQLEVTPYEMFAVLAQIQLACRHPKNVGPSREVAERVVRGWEEILAERVPQIARYAAAGWDPALDVESIT